MSNKERKLYSRAIYRLTGIIAEVAQGEPNVHRSDISRMYNVNRWDFKADLEPDFSIKGLIKALDGKDVRKSPNALGCKMITQFKAKLDEVEVDIQANEQEYRVSLLISLRA